MSSSSSSKRQRRAERNVQAPEHKMQEEGDGSGVDGFLTQSSRLSQRRARRKSASTIRSKLGSIARLARQINGTWVDYFLLSFRVWQLQ